MNILNENTKALFYFLLGGMLFFVISFKVIEKTNIEKEKKIVYLNTLYACQRSLIEKGQKEFINNISDYCQKQGTETMNGYSDLTDQLDKINDKTYSFSLKRIILNE